jgi:hypothetical protein
MPIAYPQTGVRYIEWFTAGTYTFLVPPYVNGALFDAGGAGGGGAPGFASGTQASGGGGGGSGAVFTGYPLVLIPQTTLTITIGAGGVGGTVGLTNMTGGGATTLVGAFLAGTLNTFSLGGGFPGNAPASSTVGGIGGQGGVPAQGGAGVTASMTSPWYLGGSGGATGGTNAAVGGNGAGTAFGGGSGGLGNGSGGGGGGGVFGAGGRGGQGGTTPGVGATAIAGNGSGGGGGGWNNNGANGRDGYLRLRF